MNLDQIDDIKELKALKAKIEKKIKSQKQNLPKLNYLLFIQRLKMTTSVM